VRGRLKSKHTYKKHPWPPPDVQLRVAVDAREVPVWWEDTRDSEPNLALRAFDRALLEM